MAWAPSHALVARSAAQCLTHLYQILGGPGCTGVPGCGGGPGGGAGRGAAAGRARPAARRGAVGGVGGAARRAGGRGGAVAAARRGAGGALWRAHGRVPPLARGAPAPGAAICASMADDGGRMFTRHIAWSCVPVAVPGLLLPAAVFLYCTPMLASADACRGARSCRQAPTRPSCASAMSGTATRPHSSCRGLPTGRPSSRLGSAGSCRAPSTSRRRADAALARAQQSCSHDGGGLARMAVTTQAQWGLQGRLPAA